MFRSQVRAFSEVSRKAPNFYSSIDRIIPRSTIGLTHLFLQLHDTVPLMILVTIVMHFHYSFLFAQQKLYMHDIPLLIVLFFFSFLFGTSWVFCFCMMEHPRMI